MVVFSGKKWPCLILAVYLAFTTMGMFTFVAVDSLHLDELEERGPVSGAFFAPIDHAIDCLAVGAPQLNKARAYSLSPLRHGLAMMPGIYNAGADSFQSTINSGAGTPHHNIKNTILLKLRI